MLCLVVIDLVLLQESEEEAVPEVACILGALNGLETLEDEISGFI